MYETRCQPENLHVGIFVEDPLRKVDIRMKTERVVALIKNYEVDLAEF